MEKLRASESPWRRLAAIGLVTVGLALPGSDGLAAPLDDLSLTPGPGCGAPDSLPTALRPRLVRAERAKPGVPHRKRHAAPVAPVPQPVEDPPAVLLHAFYTCAAVPLTAQRVGRGWLAVGPVQKG